MKTIILFILFSAGIFAQSNLLLFDSGYKNSETTQYVSGLTTPVLPTHAAILDNFISMVKDSFSISSLSSLADVMYLTANQTQELALRNIVKRSHDGTIGAATVTFTQYEGFAGDGATGYINTNYNANSQGVVYTLNSSSIGLYVRTDRSESTSKTIVGCQDATPNNASLIIKRSSPNIRAYINSTAATNSSSAVTTSAGMTLVTRTANNALVIYKNGVSVGTDTDLSTSVPSLNMYLCATNANGTAQGFDEVQVSFLFIGRSLDGTEARKLKNCVEWYMDQLSKGVL